MSDLNKRGDVNHPPVPPWKLAIVSSQNKSVQDCWQRAEAAARIVESMKEEYRTASRAMYQAKNLYEAKLESAGEKADEVLQHLERYGKRVGEAVEMAIAAETPGANMPTGLSEDGEVTSLYRMYAMTCREGEEDSDAFDDEEQPNYESDSWREWKDLKVMANHYENQFDKQLMAMAGDGGSEDDGIPDEDIDIN